MSHPITTLMRNMAQKLTDEIGDGLQHTETASRSLADNIVSKINSRTIEASINRIPIYIEAEILVGSIKAYVKSIKNLKHPLNTIK